MNHVLSIICTLLMASNVATSAATAKRRYKRIAYNIPLIKLSLMNKGTAMRVFKQGDDDFAVIACLDDKYIKSKKTKISKIVYRETDPYAHYLSDFEAEHILLATRSLEKTLNEFERHLKQQHWGQCVYLDAFLPRFLNNYFLLIGIAGNNPKLYSTQITLFEKKYEVSLNSQLSDDRIARWQNNKEILMKLRIASKELIHHLRLWEKKELSGKKRNHETLLNKKVEETLELFIKIYFNITTSSTSHPSSKNKPK